MAKFVTKESKTFQPFQLVIDVDTIEKAKIYASIFGSASTIAGVIPTYGLLGEEIEEIIDAEFTYDSWHAGFQVHLFDEE